MSSNNGRVHKTVDVIADYLAAIVSIAPLSSTGQPVQVRTRTNMSDRSADDGLSRDSGQTVPRRRIGTVYAYSALFGRDTWSPARGGFEIVHAL